jgi:hypothetical protein
MAARNKVRIMLDSGAFSAWKRKEELPIKEYIKFVRAHRKALDTYVGLDVIPTKSAEAAASATYYNLERMHEAHLTAAMPVFHIREDFVWLQRYLDDGETYIGLGGIAKESPASRRAWLDRVFDFLPSSTKVHGFGVADPKLLLRYPWHSADSTSCARQSGFGHVLVPRPWGHSSGFNFLAPPTSVNVTSQEPAKEKAGARPRFDALGKDAIAVIQTWLDSVGVSLEAAQTNSRARMKVNLAYFKGLADATSTRIIHAVWPKGKAAQELIDAGAGDLLVSYYGLIGCQDDWLERVSSQEVIE